MHIVLTRPSNARLRGQLSSNVRPANRLLKCSHHSFARRWHVHSFLSVTLTPESKLNKTIALAVFAAIVAMQPTLVYAKSSHATKGYTKKNGTYVAPSRATNPDKSKANNYSSKGNTNPSSGKNGTKDPNK